MAELPMFAQLLAGDEPTPPWWVLRFCKRAKLRPDQVRWCIWCQVVAFAIDEHQRSTLDALGFTGGLCPECKCPPGP